MADISFFSRGTRCQAWFDCPPGRSAPHPLIILGHGFSGTRDIKLPVFAERFREAGYATLIIEYRNFGDSEGEVRQHLNPWNEIEDWRAALAWARRQNTVDTRRIVLWGTSFGGGLVLNVAAQDSQVAATISQCPMVDGLASVMAVVNHSGMMYSTKLLVQGVRDVAQALVGQAPHYIPVVGKPGEIAAMATADAYRGFLQMVPQETAWRNEVTARTSLYLPLYRPITVVKRVKCPALFVICEQDSVAPAKATHRAARLAPRGTVISFDCGHFDIYQGEWLERNIAAQLQFLAANIPV